MLEAVQGYQLPLNHWPQYSIAPHVQLREDQSQTLKAEVKSDRKGAVASVEQSQGTQPFPPLVVPKTEADGSQ